MRMKKCMLIGLICLLSSQWMWGQHFPQMDARNYVSDTALFIPRRPWLAASEVFGMNMAVWTFDRFLMNEDFAKINGHTIKQNFKTGPVWDTDKFSTNLVAHPYHGSLYFNAARSNGLNFWQSIPFAAGGSLMWEFFMETEPPSINDMLATSFGGIELGEITYRLSDLFIDNRSHGAERVGREILSGLISPMRAINRHGRSLETQQLQGACLHLGSRKLHRGCWSSLPCRAGRLQAWHYEHARILQVGLWRSFQ